MFPLLSDVNVFIIFFWISTRACGVKRFIQYYTPHSTFCSGRMWLKQLILLHILIISIARTASFKGRAKSNDYENIAFKNNGILSTANKSKIGNAVVEKFVDTLITSEKYLKLIVNVEKKLNYLDITFHEKINSLFKYVSEILKIIKKTSQTKMMENALENIYKDLNNLKKYITARIGDQTKIQGKYEIL